MTNMALYACVIALAVYKVTENIIMGEISTLNRRPRDDWTAALIVVPYLLVIASPLVECLCSRRQLGGLSWIMGTVFFFAAIYFRAWDKTSAALHSPAGGMPIWSALGGWLPATCLAEADPYRQPEHFRHPVDDRPS
jgi:hypothetical protein